ncbi:MAG: ATP-dependent metallopeptidase FtsH/Yme1/Tma family protein [Deltaproteobacteria bacterium]|nr:ATP-dependent metallopeptidase FtsH/Yme1/Tma family protein [Deltaproteobacteria bacterium]
MKQSQKTVALWIVMILIFAVLFKLFDPGNRNRNDIKFSEFIKAVKEHKVSEVTFKSDNTIVGQFKDPLPNGKKQFETIGDTESAKVFEILDQNGITPNYERVEKTPFWQQVLISWFPMLLLFGVFFMFMRQIQVGGGKAMSFGKSRARLMTENTNRVTFKDVAGVEEARDELEEIIAFLKDPKKFTKLGGRIPKGVLLMGPPGTGKTLMARAIAGEAGVPFFSISGSDFVEMFVGVGASRVRDLFEQGKKHAPCIIFIDEIDAVGRHRGAGLGGGHDEREQTLNQLLVEMDGFESNDGVILIAATNRPDVLDPALLRPGRFDRRVVVNKPDVKGRAQILAVHTRKTPVSADVDLSIIARGTPGFSGADLENLVNEAALVAARKEKKYLEMTDFEIAKDKVLMGVERKSMVISDEEKRNTAYHEAGHTLVGKLLPGMDPIHKVTIIPRGMALGLTQTLPKEDRLSLTKEKAENTIAFMMGGRIAEEIIFGHKTTGAGNDIERATDLARRMVCEWGMSDTLGPLTFGKKEEAIFLGREIAQHRDYSEETARMIDKEVREIVERNYARAKGLLSEKVDILHLLAKALLEYEVLDGEEIEMIVSGRPFLKKSSEGSGGPPLGQSQESGPAPAAPAGAPVPGASAPTKPVLA